MNGRLLLANKDKILFEAPPTTRIVNIGGTVSNKRKHLSFPYVQYYLRRLSGKRYTHVECSKLKFYGTLHVTLSNKPMESLDDDVHIMPLPHCFDDSSFCMHPHLETAKDLPDMFEKVVADFWLSMFSHSTTFIGAAALEESLKNYKNWEQLTAKNPMDILEVKWKYPIRLSKLPYRPYSITSHPNDYNL